MNPGMLSMFLMISLVSSFAVAQAQSPVSTSTPHSVPSGPSGITSVSPNSWEGWLNHGTGEGTIGSRIPGRSHDRGAATAPRTPSIGPLSEFRESEADRSPSRLQSKREIDPAGTASDKN
jgi:hypothetical protein